MNLRPTVTLSNENGPSRSRPPLESRQATSGGQRPAHAPRRPLLLRATPGLLAFGGRRC
jgi:hypothetical protein